MVGELMSEILLVEDNPDDVELTERAFRKSEVEHTIIVARDGIEALDYLFATGKHARRDPYTLPHLVLLDLKLPRLDGLQVLERIRANPATSLLPIVILTSSVEPRDLVAAYSVGANSYVRKPVDFAQFHEATRQLALYWLVLNHPPPSRG
jgi:CheY-like chemotaxis protein